MARTGVFVYIIIRWKVLWYTNFVPLKVVTMTIDDAIMLLIIGFMVIAGVWLTALSYLVFKSMGTKNDNEETEEEPDVPEPPPEEKEETEGLKEAPESEDGVPEEGETKATEEDELKATDTE